MKFVIEKSELVKHLPLLLSAIPQKTTKKVLNSVLFDAQKDTLTLRATNEIMEVSINLPVKLEIPGAVCIDSLFASIINSFDNKEIEVSFEEKVVIKQGRRRHSPNFIPASEFPKKVEVQNYKEVDKNELIRAFTKTSFSLGKNTPRQILKSFMINPHTRSIITGDGERISAITVDLPGNIANPNGQYILSTLAAMKDNNYTVEASFGQITGLKAKLENEPVWEVIIVSMPGDYPDKAASLIEKLQSNPGELLVAFPDKEALKNILSVAVVYSTRAEQENKDRHLAFVKEGAECHFEMKVPDLVEMYEPVNCVCDGVENFTILLDPKAFKEVLEVSEEETFNVKMIKANVPLVIEENEFIHIQSPMVLPKDKTANE
jgi:DNA polymerase III sliding clamp (beta) subunit (PCNA family)